MSGNELYNHICKKYPDVQVDQAEDLNINRLYEKEITRMWRNKKKYPSVAHIGVVMRMSERQIYSIASLMNLESRKLVA